MNGWMDNHKSEIAWFLHCNWSTSASHPKYFPIKHSCPFISRAALWLFDRFCAVLDIFKITVSDLNNSAMAEKVRPSLQQTLVRFISRKCVYRKSTFIFFALPTRRSASFSTRHSHHWCYNVSTLMFFIKILALKEGKLIPLLYHVGQKRANIIQITPEKILNLAGLQYSGFSVHPPPPLSNAHWKLGAESRGGHAVSFLVSREHS